MTQLTHGTNCGDFPGNDEECTCGLKWRIEIERLRAALEHTRKRILPSMFGTPAEEATEWQRIVGEALNGGPL